MRRRLIALVAVLGVLAVLAGLTVVGQLAVSSWQTRNAQHGLLAEAAALPGPPVPSVAPVRAAAKPAVPVASPAARGEVLGTITIPRFGSDWRWALLEGTDDAVLAAGPGHYRGTPLPGERGNVALAAHRAGHGSPFLDFDRLQVGDQVRLRQGKVTWVYRITQAPKIIPVSASWVLDPLPGRQLTLTTCWPKYGSSKRMFVRATLDRVLGA